MNSLSIDILPTILTNLSLKDKYIVKRVCKVWKYAAEEAIRKTKRIAVVMTLEEDYYGDDGVEIDCHNCLQESEEIDLDVEVLTTTKTPSWVFDDILSSIHLEEVFCCRHVDSPAALKELMSNARNGLKRVSLPHSRLTGFVHLSKLVFLDVHGMDEEAIQSVVKSSPLLKDLTCSEVPIEFLPKGLKSLSIYVTVGQLATLLKSPALDSLEFLKITGKDSQASSPSPSCERPKGARILKSFTIHESGMDLNDNHQVLLISFLLRCSRLETLVLEVQLNPAHQTKLFSYICGLREITSNFNPIESSLFHAVIENNPLVEKLGVMLSEVKDEDIVPVAELKNLKMFYCGPTEKNSLTTKGVIQFAQRRKAVTDVRLEWIWMSKHDISITEVKGCLSTANIQVIQLKKAKKFSERLLS